MNIRKLFCVILTIAFIGIFSACETRGEITPSEVSGKESGLDNIEQGGFLKSCEITKPRSTSPYGPDYNADTDYRFMEKGASFLSLSSSPNGYYYICSAGGENYLYYLAKDSNQPIALCDKPNCLHEKREKTQEGSDQELIQKKLECNAFINQVECIVYSNGFLYALGNLDPMSKDQALYKISLDGSKKEVVHSFRFEENYDENGNMTGENLTFLMQNFQIHRGNMYYVLVKPEKMLLCRNNINQLDKNPEIIFEYSTDGSFTNYIIYDNYLFIKDNNNTQDTFIRINLDTFEQQDTKAQWISSIFEGKLICPSDDGIFIRDLDGTLIKKISDEPAATARGGYIITYDMNNWNEENKVLPFHLYDGNGESAGKIEITGNNFPNPVAGDSDRIFFGVYSETLEYGYLDLSKENPEFQILYKFIKAN